MKKILQCKIIEGTSVVDVQGKINDFLKTTGDLNIYEMSFSVDAGKFYVALLYFADSTTLSPII